MIQPEQEWRRFRKEHGAFLERCESMRDPYYEFANVAPSAAVPLPGAVAWNISDVEAEKRGVPQFDRLGPNTIMASSANFWAAYRQSKQAYVIDETLFASLSQARWPANCPREALVLPHNGMVLHVDLDETGKSDPLWIGACYDHCTNRESTGALEIRFVAFEGNGLVRLVCALDLRGENLQEALDFAVAKVKRHAQEANFGNEIMPHLTGIINSILYILNDEDTVGIVHPGQRPRKAKSPTNPKKARRFFDLREPDEHYVGRNFASTIERWEEEDAASNSGPSDSPKRAIRPHVRAAHAHLYWTGKGKKIPRIRFLPPIPVKGGYQDEPSHSTRRVK